MNPQRHRINTALLDQLPTGEAKDLQERTAYQIRKQLGLLAEWWLEDEVLRRADAYEDTTSELPELPSQPGGCWIVLARKSLRPLLRPALLLPLTWREGGSHSAALPTALQRLAAAVCAEVGAKLEWSLHPAGVLGDIALDDDLKVTFESGWVSLMGGLILAQNGWTPSPQVWASSAWDRGAGPARIDWLSQKIELARTWGTRANWKDPVRFFVPPGQQVEASSDERVSLEWLSYPPVSERKRVDSALAAYLAALAGQPTPDDEGLDEGRFKRCADWYVLQTDRKKAQEYYRRSLLKPLIARVQRRLALESATVTPPKILVTIVSFNPEQALLTPKALKAERCLFLHTDDVKMTRAAAEVVKEYPGCATAIPFAEKSVSDMAEKIQHELARHLAVMAPSEILFDVTPGDTMMKFALQRVIQPGNRLVCLRSDKQEDGGRPAPGREQLVVWTQLPTSRA